MFRKAFILAIILIISSLAVSAQLDEDANACNEGGSMEGKCNVDFNGDGEVSDYEVTWAWTCGWYIHRYNAGVFSRNQVPVFCSSLLPAEVPSEAGDEEPSLCYGPDTTEGPFFIFEVSDTGSLVLVSEPLKVKPDLPVCVGELPL
jgi:hypothetical protein